MSEDQPGASEGRGNSFVRKERPKISSPHAAEEPAPPTAPAGLTRGRRPRKNGGEEHTRIVVPRQQRADAGAASAIELREVRLGASGTPYLRVVPRTRRLRGVAPDHIEATEEGSLPRGQVERTVAGLRGWVLGRPLATSQAIHERLTKVKALAVLGSDPLSSSAYATEETLIILSLAGAGAFSNAIPIALVVAALMVIVVMSYRQTQKAYPSGGGAYIVAHENLGAVPGLIAGGALVVDYVLLVSVSVAAGVAAITSAVPELFDYRVPISIAVIAFFTMGNLRGIRESGTLFSAPTYFFILAMSGVVAIGLVRVVLGDAPGSVLHAAPAREEVVATQGVTLWLILRAFSSGGAALTGVEAMSNNIPNFQPPESDNARKTLTIMAAIAIYLFLGITFLSSRFGLVPSHDETIVSQLGREILGDNVLYFAYQASTALVLFLAANTSFYDFPLLSAILSRDKYMPRQFAYKGDRLAYSHGILVLAGLAILLLIAYQANTTKLIPLYAVGVFVSFTLSQSGMVVHWLRLKEPGWRASLVMNGAGAIATGVVAVIIGATKFTHGAWISILMMAILVVLFLLVRRHYEWFARQVSVRPGAALPPAETTPPPQSGAADTHVVVPVDDVNKICLGAAAMAREIGTRVTAVHMTDDREAAEAFRKRWNEAATGVPLMLVESPYRAFVGPLLAYVESLLKQEARVTVVLPTFVSHRPWQRFLHNRDILRARPHLKRLGVRVVDYKFDLETAGASPATAST